jgi:hypothetical protein
MMGLAMKPENLNRKRDFQPYMQGGEVFFERRWRYLYLLANL